MAIETKESSTGAKLLTAFPRAFVPQNISGIILPAGVNALDLYFRPALVPAGPFVPTDEPFSVLSWLVTQNLRFRFSGSAVVTPETGAGAISLESAGLYLRMFNTALARLGQLQNAARLSSTTALASNQPISFDEWDIDCNDLISAFLGVHDFSLRATLNLNNTDAVAHKIDISCTLLVEAAIFDSYRFSKWE